MRNTGKKHLIAVWMFLLTLVLISLSTGAAEEYVMETAKGRVQSGVARKGIKPGKESDAVQILFVGNSLTGRNDMPAMFQSLAAAADYKVYVEWIWEGGCTLSRYASRHTAEGAAFYRKLHSRNWDYVVLQDQTRKPLLAPSALKKSIAALSKSIQKIGAEPVITMTWAHKEGAVFYRSSYARRKKIDPKKFYRKVTALYNAVEKGNDILVAKVGTAFWKCSQYWRSIRLYSYDRVHPAREGSYLAACTLYAAIFQEEIPTENLGLSKRTGRILRRVAERVTLG